MSGLSFNQIGEEKAARLEDRFTEDEIIVAVSSLNGDKAPSPDGFLLTFG